MTGMGLLPVEVATVLGITVKTLRKHCAEELRTAALKANAAVALSVFKQATHPEKPNAVAGIFWLKCRAMWNDRGGPDFETGAEGKKKVRQAAAERVASSGRFKPSAPPRLAAVNGTTVKPNEDTK